MKLPEVLKYTEKDKIKALSYYNDDIIEYIKKYNNKEYLHWNKLQYKKGLPVEPKYLWILMKIDRKLHYKDLKFHNWTFKYYINDTIQDYLNELDKLKFIEISDEIKQIPQISDKYKIDALIEESIASSQIEGATTSKKMAKEIIKKGKKPKNKDELMIYNNYIAMKHITKIKNNDFTIEEILNIHKIITKDLMENNEYEGNFRYNNEITIRNIKDNTLLYTPPSYELIEPLMKELCNFANNDDNIHPIIKGIIIHFLIGYIHPFVDGNGRTARALFYWYMLKKGYSYFEYLKVSEIINQSKGQYRDAYLYVESEKCDEYGGDLTYFIIYLLKCIKKSIMKLDSLEQKIDEYAEKIRDLNENLNLRQQDILSEILSNPKKILTIKYVMNTYGVAYATARSDLNTLVKCGALQKKKVGKEFIYFK